MRAYPALICRSSGAHVLLIRPPPSSCPHPSPSVLLRRSSVLLRRSSVLLRPRPSPSVLIRRHPSSSVLMSSSVAIRPHPSSSVLIRPHPSSSVAIRPHPSPSVLIRRHPSSSVLIRRRTVRRSGFSRQNPGTTHSSRKADPVARPPTCESQVVRRIRGRRPGGGSNAGTRTQRHRNPSPNGEAFRVFSPESRNNSQFAEGRPRREAADAGTQSRRHRHPSPNGEAFWMFARKSGTTHRSRRVGPARGRTVTFSVESYRRNWHSRPER
jgi:hypothetical protein